MVTCPKNWIYRSLEKSCIPSGLVRGPFGGSLKKEIFKTTGNKVYEQRNAIYKSIAIGDYYVDDEKYKEMERFAVRPGDFIVSCSGTIGRIYKIPQNAPEGIINQALLKITIDEDVCYPDYFYKYFEWDKFQNKIIDDTQGGAMKNLVGMSKFRNTEIAMPQDESEQIAIAKTLSTFDNHIDNLTALIEKKKAIRDGALADLMSGRTRLAGFSGEWQRGKIGHILEIMHGKNQHAVESSVGKYPILGTGGVIGRASEYICDWECVLIGRKGTIDNPLYMNEPFWTIDTLYYSKPKADQCVKWQYYLFCTIDWYAYAESSGRPSLTRKAIEDIDILVPSYDEQKAIADILTSMDEEIKNLEKERDKIMQIREGAMDDLLTGRVRLPM